jgi:hypothetical protein
MKQWKLWIAQWLFKHLFNAISEEDLLRYVNGKFYVGGKLMDKRSAGSIASQAKNIINAPVWTYLVKDIKFIANDRMYNKSTTVDDLIFGKAMLYNLDIMETKLTNLTKIK